MILTRDGKEITAVYRQDGSEVDEVKDANGRLIYTASREITGTLPLSFSGRGKPLTDYLISGNALQDGTPTPEAPVDVVGCGVWDETRQSYKLPPTVNGTEYPIYLGQVETTRRIRKYEFTGEENGTIYSTGTSRKGIEITGISGVIGGTADVAILAICTHYNPDTRTNLYRNTDNGISNAYQNDKVIFYDANCQTVEAFRQFCAQQYAAGTPVTVWYVLAEPKTAIVNEPLMKIGIYADTITMAQAGVTIPTIRGTNVLDMTSPVKPSEVYIKGKGIKAIT